MEWLPKHKGGLELSHNVHKIHYETAKEYITGYQDDEFISIEDKKKIEDTDELWVMAWHPYSPVGFQIIVASSLEAIKKEIETGKYNH